MSELAEDGGQLPLEPLRERFAAVCEGAVDPLEVASALESDGVSDRTARAEFGAPDVFALARELYAQVPRRPAGPAPAPDTWQASRALPRGLLYAVPAVCLPAAGALLAGPGVVPTLAAALLAGWGLSQGLSAVGYLRLSAAGPDQARRVLRAGLVTGLLLVPVIVIVTGLAAHAQPGVLLFGAGVAAYMLGACVLLVAGTERELVLSLAPAVTGSALFLLFGRPPDLADLAWAMLAATPLLACAMAVACTARTGPRTGRLLIPAELRAAAPVIALGVLAAGLLAFPVLAGPAGHGGVNTGALVAVVPLALSMGAVERSLLWYRRGARRLLGETDDPGWFRGRAAWLLLAALAQYMAATIVIVWWAVDVAVATGQVRLNAQVMLSITAYLLLGAALFLMLLLQAVRVRAVPLLAAAVVLAAEVALRGHGLTVQLAAAVVLLATVGGYALSCLGLAVRHA